MVMDGDGWMMDGVGWMDGMMDGDGAHFPCWPNAGSMLHAET